MREAPLVAGQVFVSDVDIPFAGHARAFCWTEAPGGPLPIVLAWRCGEDFDDAHVYPGAEHLDRGWVGQPDGFRELTVQELQTLAAGFRPKMFNEKTMKPVLDHRGLLPSGTGVGFSWSVHDHGVSAIDIRNGEEALELGTDGQPSLFLEEDGTLWYADLDTVNRLNPGQTMVQSVALNPPPDLQVDAITIFGDQIYLWRTFGAARELRVYLKLGVGVASCPLPIDQGWTRPTAEHPAQLAVGLSSALVLQGHRMLCFGLPQAAQFAAG